MRPNCAGVKPATVHWWSFLGVPASLPGALLLTALYTANSSQDSATVPLDPCRLPTAIIYGCLAYLLRTMQSPNRLAGAEAGLGRYSANHRNVEPYV
jgi:hypothetical protein